ncbi:amidohydrolase [Acidisoma cellulosilytica]|uniref:Amidohydrolase n=1 Tax=Acidisoma cellulosilyticum TaxID=2802395 RepID=A0A963Z4L3_9PROT|nr:M20 aminoacylase family protein [Acidisoma cellulosilyticum]MCB8882371.1 amidohydrolase [Acidisoma cellulosilyticum]
MPIINRIADFHEDMTAWRRDLHAHPELGFDLPRTSAVVAERLREFGVDEVVTGIAQTGVVGVIRGRNAGNGRAIGLRADMDALPIPEETGVPYASLNPGVMHACGHDGHTTMLLGAARYLAETRNFDGTVYVIFQPAEEGEGGAKVMVDEGLFQRFPMQQVFGMHNWPTQPAGTFVWGNGAVMAATGEITITVTGRGAHGAKPNEGVDPILVAAHILTGLQSIVARRMEPTEAGVVTIGSIVSGVASNVIPERAVMTGTSRWFSPSVGDVIEAGVKQIATGVAAAFGATAVVEFKRNYPATVNDVEATKLATYAAETVAGSARVSEMERPTMGAEDFSYMLNEKPGSYIMLGTARGANDPGLHHPLFDFNDEVLPVGASYWATLTEQLLRA